MNKKNFLIRLAIILLSLQSINQTAAIQKEKPNLVFFGCQVTSNNPEQATIVEIAVIVTDWQLNILAEGPSLIINQPDCVLAEMDDYFKNKYVASGLLEKIKTSTISLADAEAQILAWIKPYTQPKQSPMFGGMWFGRDYRTMRRLMPKLAAHLSTKALGTFTLRELAELWNDDTTFEDYSRIVNPIDEAHATIVEMRYYKDTYFTQALT